MKNSIICPKDYDLKIWSNFLEDNKTIWSILCTLYSKKYIPNEHRKNTSFRSAFYQGSGKNFIYYEIILQNTLENEFDKFKFTEYDDKLEITFYPDVKIK